MTYRLPPLNALRVFEATSRLLSAKQAALELHVTPAAVSHQIKLLETQLGFPLFNRLNRQLILTELGQRYSRSLQDIFKKLSDETEKLTQNVRSRLTVTVEPAFAIYWLIPRLDKFRTKFPQIELRISSSYELIDLKKNDIDIGIRWGNGKYPGLTSTLLFRNTLYPVCSPAILEKHAIRKPSDLQFHTLLHEINIVSQCNYPNWSTWIKEFGASGVNSESGLFFETGYLLIQAAIDGQGVALERSVLVENAIKSGKLVKLFNKSVSETINGYYIVFPENRALDAKIQSFINWVKAEIKIR